MLNVTYTISMHHELRDAIGLGAGQDLREHVGMHPIAGRVLGSRFHLVRRDGVGELAVFPRQNDVLNEQRQVDEQQQRRRVLKEADERDVGIDDGQPDRAVEEEVLVAHGWRA